MKVLILGMLCFLFGLSSYGQQCGYENHSAILVKVVDATTKLPIRGLNIVLTYENGKPIEVLNEQDAKDPKDRLPCYDTYVFWENTGKKIPQPCGHYNHMYRQVFPNAGDHYICVVPSYTGLIDMSQFAQIGLVSRGMPWSGVINFREGQHNFFINIKIQDKDGAKQGGYYATQQIRIPIAAITDICRSHLDGSDGQLRNGETLNTIYVELKANDTNYKATIHHDKFDTYLVPYYEVFPVVSNNPEDEVVPPILSIHKIELYDEQTTMLLQTITPPFDDDVFWANGQIQYGNFYNEPGAKKLGFRVPAHAKEANVIVKDCFYYYCYNQNTKLYEPDSLLNSKPKTNFNKDLKRMFASEQRETKDAKILFHYELKNRQWVLVQTDTLYKPKPPEAIVPVKMAQCFIEIPNKTKAVQYFDTGNVKFIVDTFWIANYGNEKARLTVVNGFQTGGDFTVPKEILPQERLPIVYRREFIGDNIQNNNIKEVHGPYEFISDGVRIEYGNKEQVMASISYCILSHDAIQHVLPDSSRHFEVQYQSNRRKVVNTFPNGFLKEYGDLYMPDSCKIGEWTVIDSSQTYAVRKEQHNKLFRLHIANAPIEQCTVTVIKGWSATVLPASQNQEFPMSKDVKSIMVSYANSEETKSAVYSIDFDKLQQEDGVTLNLLSAGESFYYQGQIKMPLQLNHHQYKVIFDIQFAANKMKQVTNTLMTDDWQPFYFTELQKEFPNLMYYNIDTADEWTKHLSYPYYVLDFSRCSEQERVQLFSILEEDSNIKALSKLQHPNAQSFCDQMVYILDTKINALDSSFLAKAKSLGFTFQNTQTGMSHYQYNFTYNAKIIDEKFYKAFNRLCASYNYGLIHLNVYGYARPEEGK